MNVQRKTGRLLAIAGIFVVVLLAVAAIWAAPSLQGAGGRLQYGPEADGHHAAQADGLPADAATADAPPSIGEGMVETPDGFYVPAHELYVEAKAGMTREQLEAIVEELGCANGGVFGGANDRYGSSVPLTAYVRVPDGAPIWEVRAAFANHEGVAECRYLQEVDPSAMGDDGEACVATPDGKLVWRGRLDVVAADGVTADELRSAIEKMGCSAKRIRGGAGDSVMPEGFPCYAAVAVPEDRDLWDVRDGFLELPEIAECHYQLYIADAISDNDEIGEPEPDPDEPGEPTAVLGEDCYQYYLNLSGFTGAWDTVMCDGDVSIGIIDTGIAFTDAELAANIDTGNMMNAITGDTGLSAFMTDEAPWPPDSDPEADYGGDGTFRHGTSVAAVAAAVADGGGCDGASHNAVIVPVKYKTAQSAQTTADALDAILDGYEHLESLGDAPAAIEMSFVISRDFMLQEGNLARFLEFESLIAQARSRGVVTVAAAGNDGADGNGRHYPACYPLVISVGALAYPPLSFNPDEDAPELASFSNTASDVDICAFGEQLGTIRAYGTGANHYRSASGTSFAVPQVAAAIALVRAHHPNWTADDVEAAVLLTAKHADGFVDEDGDGIDDGGCFGHGALDAAGAVEWVPSDDSGAGGQGGGTGGGGAHSPGTAAGDGDDVRGEVAAAYLAQLAAQGRMAGAGDGEIASALAGAMAANPDVFGWLRVPGTNVSLPLCRREGDDSHYLSHAADGSEAPFGAAYVEAANSPSMGDPLTVAYGHTCRDAEVAFTRLHRFGYRPFFDAHDKVSVYLPGKILEYRVAAASVLDDGHILGGVAAAGPGALSRLCAAVTDGSLGCNLARDGVSVSAGDRVLMLSTCSSYGYRDRRFVVTCVLKGEREL